MQEICVNEFKTENMEYINADLGSYLYFLKLWPNKDVKQKMLILEKYKKLCYINNSLF